MNRSIIMIDITKEESRFNWNGGLRNVDLRCLEDSVLDLSWSTDPEKKEHPRFSKSYKNAGRKAEEQKKRREAHLQKQKDARHDFQALARSLLDLNEEESEMMDEKAPNPFRSPRKRIYKDQLMLSEWFVDIPMDFSEKWLAVPCPVGKRNLVVAGRGKTQFYSRKGSYLGSFPSYLPQGKRMATKCKPNLTLLDCVYHEASKVFYVLDIIIWDGMPFDECDTAFRSFWIKTKMEEVKADTKSKYNPCPFIPLPYFHSGQLQTLFNKPVSTHFRRDNVDLDGILFYHSDAFYLPGPTPLVGWLKGYMVSELISDLLVHPDYVENRPIGYSSMMAYIDEYNSADKEKKKIFTFQKKLPPQPELTEKDEKIPLLFCSKRSDDNGKGHGVSEHLVKRKN
ncbi:SNUPN [Lepeophtheirus salmonis]|uniref:Snurportin-1 n=1 Tax=Lepeophtheirus salmonis TaxID=72036 RepID=A0A7R8CAG5_LEPSM|nr:SNUPN [Lepeophtheirus salmonis]CAF2751044.1 SNUPN [Lepeophtheirus salmonis]